MLTIADLHAGNITGKIIIGNYMCKALLEKEWGVDFSSLVDYKGNEYHFFNSGDNDFEVRHKVFDFVLGNQMVLEINRLESVKNKTRYNITKSGEIPDGMYPEWHFCNTIMGKLVHKTDEEFLTCTCGARDDVLSKTHK